MKPFKFHEAKPQVHPYHQPKRPTFKPRYNTKPSKVRLIVKNFRLVGSLSVESLGDAIREEVMPLIVVKEP